MNEQELSRIVREERGLSLSQAFPALMRKVYTWMTLALAITGLTAYYVANNTEFVYNLFGSGLMWGLVIAELVIVFVISGMINKLSVTTATLLFVAYSILNGLTIAPLLLVYTGASVARVFFITAGTFAAMAVFGYTTKRDLSPIGRFLFMGLIGIIIATLVNVFFVKSAGMDLILSYLGVLIFVGLTAYDSQKIKEMLALCPEPDAQAQKLALLGSLTLYLDFINLFLYLLRIFDSRD